MNKQQFDEYENALWQSPVEEIESRISRLKESIGKISKVNDDIRTDPRSALCKMKERQLEEVLKKYGQVRMDQLSTELCVLQFSRIQAMEELIRNDIAEMKKLDGGEKQLKKQLAIANKVLAEKIQPGGRS